MKVVVLNEKDADRIASCLRNSLKQLEGKKDYTERFHKNFRVMLGLTGEDSKELEMANNEILMEYKAQEAEIAELIALLMTGSEE